MVDEKKYTHRKITMTLVQTYFFDYATLYKQNIIKKWTKGHILQIHKKGDLGTPTPQKTTEA